MTRANFSGMRLLCAVILAGLCCLTAKAEDWTVNGKTYHNVTVGQVEADRVHITFDGGIGSLMLVDLTPELQKRFNYDPAKAKATEVQKDEDAKPDWQKINDASLKPWVLKVEQLTNLAYTADEKIAAEGKQSALMFLHKLLTTDPDLIVVPSSGEDHEIVSELKDAANFLAKLSPHEKQKIVDDYMERAICVGMPKAFVILEWGKPDSDTTSTSGDGDDWETLDYGHFSSTVFISGGIVKNITQTQTP
jgi:hypothetical protein